MEKGIFGNKLGIAKLFIIAIVVVVAAGSVAGAYYLSLPASTASPSPSPTQQTQPTNPQTTSSPTQSANPTQSAIASSSPTESSEPTATSAFPTPTSQASGNFRVGAYANYLLTDYLTSPNGTTTNIKLSVTGEESYSSTPCWVYVMTTETDFYGVSAKVVTTKWLSKSTLECMHIRVQSYADGELTDDDEYAGDSNEGSDMPSVIKAVVGAESITVTAGTFNNCVKDEQAGPSGQGSREWVSVDVPIWGLVKLETYLSSGTISIYELTAYGG